MYNLERELKIRGFSRKTTKAYLHYNRKFLNFARKSPKEITNEDIKRYLEYLANKKFSNTTLNLSMPWNFIILRFLKENSFLISNIPKKKNDCRLFWLKMKLEECLR